MVRKDGVECLDCLLWVERGGRGIGVWAVVETEVSGFRVAKEFEWESKRVE